MEEKDTIKVELKSEVLNEVLSTPPSWLARSGNTLFFVIILLILALSYIISYPDELQGEAMIFNSRPPIEFHNAMYGKLVNLQVKDKQEIKQNQIIAQFNVAVVSEDLNTMKFFLDKISKTSKLTTIEIPTKLNLIKIGSLQQNWNNLLVSIHEWNAIHTTNILHNKKTAIQQEIIQRKKLLEIGRRKTKLIERELALQHQQLKSSQRLYSNNAISKDEVLKDERAENQLQQSYNNQKEAIIQIEIQLASLSKSLLESDFDTQQQLQKLESSIFTQVSSLQNQLIDWEKSAAWVAPMDGKILFNKQLNVSNFYQTGEASIVLVPKGFHYKATVRVASQGAGKISKGQKVFIECLDYPKHEYGVLEGHVMSMTSIARTLDKQEIYEVEVSLPKKLITTYKKEIPVKAQLKGVAKIITQDKRLIYRFFEKVLNTIEKK
jgi:hypothetical protein